MAQVQLVKWGNSHAVRLPKSIIEEAEIKEGEELEMVVLGQGRIEISRAKEPLTLQRLVDAITADNCHDETSWGSPIGKEQW